MWMSRPSGNIHDHAQSQDQQQKIPVQFDPQMAASAYQGFIESFDNHINTGSGTIRARARFDNKDGALVPGMFVSVRMADAADSTVLLVPSAPTRASACLRRRQGQQGRFPRGHAGPECGRAARDPVGASAR